MEGSGPYGLTGDHYRKEPPRGTGGKEVVLGGVLGGEGVTSRPCKHTVAKHTPGSL